MPTIKMLGVSEFFCYNVHYNSSLQKDGETGTSEGLWDPMVRQMEIALMDKCIP